MDRMDADYCSMRLASGANAEADMGTDLDGLASSAGISKSNVKLVARVEQYKKADTDNDGTNDEVEADHTSEAHMDIEVPELDATKQVRVYQRMSDGSWRQVTNVERIGGRSIRVKTTT